jgi:uncharacterized protein YkwD
MSQRLLLACLAGLFLTGCAALETAQRMPAERISISTADGGVAAALISTYRAARGLSAVKVDAALNQAAEHHARAVAQAGKLSHGDFGGRMASFGLGGVNAAENLAAGQATVAKAVAGWKASPGHNENLLMPEARRIGLAHARSAGAGYEDYWVLVLAE